MPTGQSNVASPSWDCLWGDTRCDKVAVKAGRHKCWRSCGWENENGPRKLCNKVQYKWCVSLKQGSKGYGKAQVYKGGLACEPGLSIRFLLQGQNWHVKRLWRTRSLSYAHVVTSVSNSCLHNLREAEWVDVLLLPSGAILKSRKESAVFTCAYITLTYCYSENFFFCN